MVFKSSISNNSGGGSGTPGGSNGQVQYNSNGTFGGISGATTDGTTLTTNSQVLNGTVSGTAVSTTASANDLVLRDGNANSFANNYIANATATTSAGGTTVLTAASSRFQALTGSSSQTYQLPDATTLTLGPWFVFNNNSSGSLIITNNGGTTLYTVPAGGIIETGPSNISTANGSWDFHGFFPGTVTWGSGVTGLVFNTALTTTPSISAGISSASNPSFIPQRGSSTTGYGGDSTHLYGSISGTAAWTATATGFNIPTGSTYQINGSQIAFSNIAGTAAVNQGGTGQTTYTDGQLLIGNSSGNTLTKSTLTAGSNITITNGNGSITIAASASGSIPQSSFNIIG